MKKTEFDSNGLPIGHYDTAIHGKNIPSAAVEVTDEEYQDMIDNQGNRKRNLDTGEMSPIISSLDKMKEKRKEELQIGAKRLIDELTGLAVAKAAVDAALDETEIASINLVHPNLPA